MADVHKSQYASGETRINTAQLQDSITTSNDPHNKDGDTHTSEDKCQIKNCLFIGAASVPAVIILVICIPIFCCAAVGVLPLLLISLIVTRLIQFIRHDEHGYIKAFQVKLIIRNGLCIDVLFILLGIGLLLLLAIITNELGENGLKSSYFLDVDYLEWIGIISMTCGFYLLSFLLLKSVHAVIKTRDHAVVEAVSEIIDCLIFLWAECRIKKQVSVYRRYTILGCRAHKWIEAVIGLLIGYNLITLFTHLLVSSLSVVLQRKNHKFKYIFEKLNSKYIVYYANGLKWSIDFVLSVLMLLATWVFYFDEHIDETIVAPAPGVAAAPALSVAQALKQGQGVCRFGTKTLLILLICAILWLIKTVVLLAWNVHTVYDRLRNRILENGEELYYLCVLGDNYGIFNQDKDRSDEKEIKKDEVKKILSGLEKGSDPTLDDVQRIVYYFLFARSHLCKETYTSDILRKISNLDDACLRKKLVQEENKAIGQKNAVENSSGPRPKRKKITSGIGWCFYAMCSFICFSSGRKSIESSREAEQKVGEDEDDVKCSGNRNCWLQELPKKDGDSFREAVIQWVVRAHSRCMILANTLSSAKEVADCLNHIISVLILGATFIMWILFTKLTTTQVLVLFASPLLAATFIFGNTCKTLFQSIIFVFVVHPFDVGDLCVIDDLLLEVKTVGVWKTTLSKVGLSQEEVIYPNSQLSDKRIINHKTAFDWSDHVEFDVGTMDKQKINHLKQEIERYLDGNKDVFAPGYNIVEVMRSTMGDNLKIAIDFRHNINLKNSIYLECLKEKRKLRSKLVVDVQDLVDQKKIIRSSTKTSVDTCNNNKGSPQSIEGKPEEECDEKMVETEKDSSNNEDKEANKGVLEITEDHQGKQRR